MRPPVVLSRRNAAAIVALLQASPGAADDCDPSDDATANAPPPASNVQSDKRLQKRVSLLHDQLTELGFGPEQIERSLLGIASELAAGSLASCGAAETLDLSGICDALTRSACLDWLCLRLEDDEVGGRLKYHHPSTSAFSHHV